MDKGFNPIFGKKENQNVASVTKQVGSFQEKIEEQKKLLILLNKARQGNTETEDIYLHVFGTNNRSGGQYPISLAGRSDLLKKFKVGKGADYEYHSTVDAARALIEALAKEAEEKIKTLTDSKESNIEEPTKEELEYLRQYRIHKMRVPFMGALFKYLQSIPHIWDQVLVRYEKVDDFNHIAHELESDEDGSSIDDVRDRIKLLTPFWSAVATIPEARAYLEIMLDEATKSESDAIKEEMKRGEYFVEELNIGAGVHGAIYNSEFVFHSPKTSRLTVDRNSTLGGQFRQYGPVIYTNSSNRPLNTEVENQLDNPNMNTFGSHAPVQVTDVSGQMFTSNSEMGFVAALDQYLSANTAVNMTVVKVRKNLGKSPGKFLVDLVDNKTGDRYTINSNRIIASTGLGMPDYGFLNMDDKTKSICESGDGRVMRYDEFLTEIGNRANPFPLERFVDKRVVIIGGGHSGLTTAEALSGFSPEYRGSVASLGGPTEITVLGAKAKNSKEFLSGEIPRYGQLAGLIQDHDKLEGERSKILRLEPDLRAVSIEDNVVNGKKGVRIFYKNKGQDGDTGLGHIDADIVITTAGFTHGYGDIFSELFTEQEGVDNQFTDVLSPKESAYPIARCLKSYPDVIFDGPAAKLALNESDAANIKLFHRPKNADGLPSTSADTQILARSMALKDKSMEVVIRNEIQKFSKINIPPVDSQSSFLSPLSFSVPISEEAENRRFSPEVHYDAILELSLLGHEKKYSTAKQMELSFVVELNKNNVLDFKSTDGFSAPQEEVVRSLGNTELFQAAIARLLNRKPEGKRSVPITLKLR